MRKAKKVLTFLFFFQILITQVFAAPILRKRAEPTNYTTSIIIPCVARHFKHLEGLLQSYEQQTVVPNEVVISLSDIETMNPHDVTVLENYPWKFALKIIKNEGKRSAGENRNLACSQVTSDIILCQDADDLPHPQRVELVKYAFENYQVDFLLHRWLEDSDSFPLLKKEEVPITLIIKFDVLGGYCGGNPCLSKKVCRELKWPDSSIPGEDRDFNILVFKHFRNRVFLDANIYKYRYRLSSFNPNN